MRLKRFFGIALLIFFTTSAAFAMTLDDYYNQFKNRLEREVVHFTRVAGWTSQFRALSPSAPLGIWGFDGGLELTSIPNTAFKFSGYALDMPPFFPRIALAKGITKFLDLEASLLAPKLLVAQDQLPDEMKSLLIYGGALKYTFLNEAQFFFSLAGRASFTRLALDFFKSDIYGADMSISRALAVPLTIPLTVTPYAGVGYISTTGEFDDDFIPFISGKKRTAENYRMFSGLSIKAFVVDVTGQVDVTGDSNLNTYSLKISLDI